VNNLPKVITLVLSQRELNLLPIDHKSTPHRYATAPSTVLLSALNELGTVILTMQHMQKLFPCPEQTMVDVFERSFLAVNF